MQTLAIETSCDETSLAIVAHEPGKESFRLLAHTILSQAQKHAEFGGVYPTLAKREHTKTLIPLFIETLKQANIAPEPITVSEKTLKAIKDLLAREPELFVQLALLLKSGHFPRFDQIAVVAGPGLAPSLWIGVNFARALATITNTPLLPINHMEGHIFSALIAKKDATNEYHLIKPQTPALALLISGGHTQIIHIPHPWEYRIIGQSRDDAVGEAFDKVARLLGFPYPGGPHIAKAAQEARANNWQLPETFPRPMEHADNYDFSFAGLKTAVRYFVQKHPPQSEKDKAMIARAFEDAVADVLAGKLKKAARDMGAASIILGGGVSANDHIKASIAQALANEPVTIHIAPPELTGDNALMSAAAAVFHPPAPCSAVELHADARWRIDTPYTKPPQA